MSCEHGNGERKWQSGSRHFYFTGDDYRYKLEAEAKQRLINCLRERFNSGVKYKRQILRWDIVIGHKAVELGQFLVGRHKTLNFESPSPALYRSDSVNLREKILSLTTSRTRELGIGKSTLHYLRYNAENARSFHIYAKTEKKLTAVDTQT